MRLIAAIAVLFVVASCGSTTSKRYTSTLNEVTNANSGAPGEAWVTWRRTSSTVTVTTVSNLFGAASSSSRPVIEQGDRVWFCKTPGGGERPVCVEATFVGAAKK